MKKNQRISRSVICDRVDPHTAYLRLQGMLHHHLFEKACSCSGLVEGPTNYEWSYSYRLLQINEFDWGFDSPREYKWPPTKLTGGFPGAHTLLFPTKIHATISRPTWDKTWVMETSILSSTWVLLQPWRIFHPVLFLKV